MESGDHMEGPKDKQHADFVAMENLPKIEQISSARALQTGDGVENFLLQGGVPLNKGVASWKDINEFILHESGATVPRNEFNDSQEQERKESENLNPDIVEISQNIQVDPSANFPSVGPDNQHDSLERISKAVDKEQTSTKDNLEGNHENLNPDIVEISQNIQVDPSANFPSVSPDNQHDSLERISKAVDKEQTSTKDNLQENHENLNPDIVEISQNIQAEKSANFPSVSPDSQHDSLERISKAADNEQTSTKDNLEGNHDIVSNSIVSQEDGRGDSVFLDNKVNDEGKSDGQSNESQLTQEVSVNSAEENVSNEKKAEEDGPKTNADSHFFEIHPKTKEHDEKAREEDTNKENGGMESGSKTDITAAGDLIHSERSDVTAGSEKGGVSVDEEHLEFISHESDVKNSTDSKGILDSKTNGSQFVDTEKVVSGLQKEDSDSHKSFDIVLGDSDAKLRDEEPTSKDEIEEEWLDIVGSGQLMKKILRKAENDYRPQNSFICEINLECRLEDGTVVEKYENTKIQVGDFEVVQGIDLALPLMNVGEVALLEIGPRFAYGSLGKLPEIPPDAKLTYQIELVSAENEPEMESLSISERRQIGDKKRERGNWWYARKEYSFAIQSYRRALEFLDDAEGGFSVEKKDVSENTEKQFQELLEDRLKVYNNLAAAHIMNKSYDAALISVENVLRCQPQNVKALRRKAKILAAKGDATGALSILRNASQLEPDSTSIKQEMHRLQDVIKQDTKQEKSLYKKMLGQNKTAEKFSPKPPKISYRTWGIVCSSVAVVLLGAVAYRYKFL